MDSERYKSVQDLNVLKRNYINWQVVIIWESPIINNYESRTAFFSEQSEAYAYEDSLIKAYEKLGYTYTIDTFYIGNDDN